MAEQTELLTTRAVAGSAAEHTTLVPSSEAALVPLAPDPRIAKTAVDLTADITATVAYLKSRIAQRDATDLRDWYKKVSAYKKTATATVKSALAPLQRQLDEAGSAFIEPMKALGAIVIEIHETLVEIAQEEAARVMQAIVQAKTAEEMQVAATMRTTPKGVTPIPLDPEVEIVDESLVPLVYKEPSKARLIEAYKQGTTTIPGVVFHPRSTVRVT